MWPLLVFLLAVALVVVQFWVSERLHARQQARSRMAHEAEVRRRQEEAFSQSQAQQQALFDSMVEGVLILDPQNRIHLVNASLQRMFGFTRAPLRLTIMEAFRLAELQSLQDRLQQEDQVREIEIELRQSETRWIEVNASGLHGADRQYQGAILVFHDLTQLKKLEKTRQEFVANVSHELRTPLSLIKGFVETLLEGALHQPAVAERFVQTIQRHTDRLTFLIEDLLMISKLESGRTSMNSQAVRLRVLVAEVNEDLAKPAAAKNIRLENLVPHDLEGWADPDRLRQVFFNLVDNAIKYCPTAGVTQVGGSNRTEGGVELWVRDNGPGIPAEARERVFERFYRLDKARSRENGGTGLGLAIVKHIVQAHGGAVWVQPAPDSGAEFHLSLPARGET